MLDKTTRFVDLSSHATCLKHYKYILSPPDFCPWLQLFVIAHTSPEYLKLVCVIIIDMRILEQSYVHLS